MLENVKSLQMLAQLLRKRAIDIGYNCGNEGAHFGGTLSLIEIMIALYKEIIPKDKSIGANDKVILSKGHGVLAQYLLMENVGLLGQDKVDDFKKDFAVCAAHPSRDLKNNIEFSAGSLGQGLSLGFGIALARKKNNDAGKIFVILGDGECDEGSIWEAVGSAAQYKTDNLIAIIDKNGFQYNSSTDEVMNLRNMKKKFEAFGWNAEEVDGHNIEALVDVLREKHDKPFAVIAHTIKGKGISFMENQPEWHHKVLTKELYYRAMTELKKERTL